MPAAHLRRLLALALGAPFIAAMVLGWHVLAPATIVAQDTLPPPRFVRAWGSLGAGNGQFNDPAGVAINSGGLVYVADSRNHRIQQFSGDGAFVLTWGGRGAGAGHFETPKGVAVGLGGTVYVADTGNNRIQRFTGSGTFVSSFGSRGSGPGQFDEPTAVAVGPGPDFDVYVADTGNDRIQRFSPAGVFLNAWDADPTVPGFVSRPIAVATDSGGGVWVINERAFQVQTFNADGSQTGMTFSSTAKSVGIGPDNIVYFAPVAGGVEEFATLGFIARSLRRIWSFPFATFGLAVGAGDRIYLADSVNHRIVQVDNGPTISPIPDQQGVEGSAVGPIPFRLVESKNGNEGALIVTATSSNPGLLSNAGLALGGSGADRTIALAPAASQSGSATVTLNVTGPSGSASENFVLTVQAVNDPPSISAIADQSTPEDTAAGPIPFTIGDAETAPGALTVTAVSSDPDLLPPGRFGYGGGGAARTVTLSPAANRNGAATVTLSVSDGSVSTSTTFRLTVTPVNDPPTAAADAYAAIAEQALTVPAPGVLANDADADSPPLTVARVGGPAHGTLALNPNGGFAYTPNGGFAGTDRFTYRASDGAAQSNVATATIQVAPIACVPRPRVLAQPAAGGGKLLVTVSSTGLSTPGNNPLRELRFGRLDNARVTVAGRSVAGGQTFHVPPGLVSLDFAVEREVPGRATTVSLTVVDGCGEWPTFVGGGTAAGF